jgi:ATP-binding cassette subfamily B protein
VVLALPLVLAPILLFGRRVRSLSRQSQDRVADVGSYVAETWGRSRPCRPTTTRRGPRAVRRHRRSGVRVARKRIAQRAWLITLVIVLVLGAVG